MIAKIGRGGWCLMMFLLMGQVLQVQAQQTPKQLQEKADALGESEEKFLVFRQLAQAYLNQKDYEQAITTATAALAYPNHSNDPKLIQILARAHTAQKAYPAALNYYLRLQQIYANSREQSAQAKLEIEIAELYRRWGISEKAAEYYIAAYERWQQMRFKKAEIEALVEVVSLYQSGNNYTQALAYNQLLINCYKEQRDTVRILNALANMVDMHIALEQPEAALQVEQQILDQYQRMEDTEGMARAHNNLGFLYRKLGQVERSLESFQAAQRYSSAPNPITYINIGITHQALGNYPVAQNAFMDALKIWEAEENPIECARTYNHLATLYQQKGDPENTYRFAKQALNIAQQEGDEEILLMSYQILSDLYAEAGRSKKALVYYKSYTQIKERRQLAEKEKLKDELQQLLQAQQREQALKLMLVDQQINQMTLKRLQLENEKKDQNFQITLQQRELLNAQLREQELQKDRDLKQLRLEKQRIEDEKRQRELSILLTQDSLQKLVLQQKLLEEQQREREFEFLQQKEAVQRLMLAEEKAEAAEQQRFLRLLLGSAILVLLLILIGYWTKRRDNKKLQTQQNILNQQNQRLQLQTDEIQMQAEELTQQRDEIAHQRDYLEEQKTALQRAYDNIRILSQIGQKITATLHLSQIIQTVYQSVNQLMDASCFGIGVYNTETKAIDFKDFVEKEQVLPFSSDSIEDTMLPAVRCFLAREELVVNDLKAAIDLLALKESPERGQIPDSFIYLPLTVEDRTIGVITVQSFKENAYTEDDVTLLRSLAAYVAIALDNSDAYAQVQQANDVIAEKNEQIMASLRYARTIEEAILPSEEWFDRHFTDHFTIFLPKDIVSGDFYWGYATQNTQFVGVIDCTGHGVPGAFMSMTANALLNRIIKEDRVHDPARVLEQLHQNLEQMFKQREEGNIHTGMDVALIRLDRRAKEIHLVFAAAKRPLYLFKNNTLHTLRGDRTSIGHGYKHSREVQFQTHEIILQAGDAIYLSTDGFTDNPGQIATKIGTTVLKETLENIHTQPMGEQKNTLLALLKKQQQDQPQRDDITLIGLRL